MRARATCRHCGREILLCQLYTATAGRTELCPHCSRHLGVLGLHGLALGVDRSGDELVRCLRELGDRHPAFEVDPDSVLGPVGEALAPLTASRTTSSGAPEEGGPAAPAARPKVRPLRWPWRPPRRPAP